MRNALRRYLRDRDRVINQGSTVSAWTWDTRAFWDARSVLELPVSQPWERTGAENTWARNFQRAKCRFHARGSQN